MLPVSLTYLLVFSFYLFSLKKSRKGREEHGTKRTAHFPVLFLKKKKNWKTFKISEALLVKISRFRIRPVSGLGREVLQLTQPVLIVLLEDSVNVQAEYGISRPWGKRQGSQLG